MTRVEIFAIIGYRKARKEVIKMRRINKYKPLYNVAAENLKTARNNAIRAAKEAGIEIDGSSVWEDCFFGETKEAFEKAREEFNFYRELYWEAEERLSEERQNARKRFENAHPEIVAERNRRKSLG